MRASRRFLNRPIQTHQTDAAEPFFAPAQQTGAQAESEDSFFSPAQAPQPPKGAFASGTVQTKLTVNAPCDKHEQEADMMADKVVQRMSAPEEKDKVHKKGKPEEEEKVQRMSAPEEEKDKVHKKGKPEEEEPLQRKCAECEKEEGGQVQRQSDGSSTAPSGVTQQINSSKGQGSKLSDDTRTQMESSFGTDFSNVTIHTDHESTEMNNALHAQAFTHGSDIYFNEGKYNPQNTEGGRLLAHELTHVVQQGGANERLQRFPITNVSNVKSLAMETFSGGVDSAWSFLGKKLNQRDKVIAGRLKLVKAGSPEESTLLNLQNRWSNLRLLISNITSNTATLHLPTTTTQDIIDEQTDKALLPSGSNKYVIGSITEFITALSTFSQKQVTLSDEKTEFARFDTLYTDRDVQTLLKAIKQGTFTAADVKAIHGTETGDLTNTAVKGISSSKKGIKSSRANRGGHVGLGQHDSGAMSEAITWASKNGVTIPKTPDPRETPSTSIKLTAAFLGRVVDILIQALPATLPTGDEFKKFVFAAYNGGHVGVVKAVKSFLIGKKTTTYTWQDVIQFKTITTQMKNYVADTIKRLT